MSKEFDKLKGALSARVEEIATASKLAEDAKKIRDEEKEKSRKEYEERLAENKKRFEDAGIINLFNEIIASEIVTMSPAKYKTIHRFENGVFGRRIDLGPSTEILSKCSPAIIRWESENRIMILDFNLQSDQYDNPYTDSIRIRLLESGRFGLDEVTRKDGEETTHVREIEDISDIPMYVGRELAKYSGLKNNGAL